jgi:hypothetical protein
MPISIFSDSDSEDEENSLDYEYNCEEKSTTRFNIVLCELYNKRIHGDCENSLAKHHYLVTGRFKKFNIEYINKIIRFLNNCYLYLPNYSHSIYRNYRNIILNPNYLKPEIAECIDLDTQERIAIIKTIWIKLIQRTWKNIFKKRKEIILKRCNPFSLRYREIYGKWPKDCSNYPTLKGMMYSII